MGCDNSTIFTSTKKYPIPSEYFIWTSNSIISRARMTGHLFIAATFNHPDNYSQLLIIIFKDLIISLYLAAFIFWRLNKTEILYNLIFSSVKRILTQNNIYNLIIETIKTDSELINAINNNFPNSQRIGCWFNLKQDLLREAKTLGLLNKKIIKSISKLL